MAAEEQYYVPDVFTINGKRLRQTGNLQTDLQYLSNLYDYFSQRPYFQYRRDMELEMDDMPTAREYEDNIKDIISHIQRIRALLMNVENHSDQIPPRQQERNRQHRQENPNELPYVRTIPPDAPVVGIPVGRYVDHLPQVDAEYAPTNIDHLPFAESRGTGFINRKNNKHYNSKYIRRLF
jgi:hypothetical protein